jgi:bacteriorhodopsin
MFADTEHATCVSKAKIVRDSKGGSAMPQLTTGEFSIVYNLLSFTLAAMIASFIFFVLRRDSVAPQYRGALVMSALVVAIAGYHYFRIFNSWNDAYTISNSMYIPTGKPYNNAYRYVDWFLTVPLLIAELIAVMKIPAGKRTSLTARLVIAAALMIVLGYPGEIATTPTTRAIWGVAATIPFLYILYELFVGLRPAVLAEEGRAKTLLSNIRFLLFATWGFYPIVFAIPVFFGNVTDPVAIVAVQVGYCLADVIAKCGYGLMIYAIARAKTESEQKAAAVTNSVGVSAVGN